MVAEFINLIAGKLQLAVPNSKLEVIFKDKAVRRSVLVPRNTSDDNPLIIREMMYSCKYFTAVSKACSYQM